MIQIIALTGIILLMHGVLWYQHPTANVWLFGSLFLGVVWSVAFLHLITRPRP